MSYRSLVIPLVVQMLQHYAFLLNLLLLGYLSVLRDFVKTSKEKMAPLHDSALRFLLFLRNK